MSCIISATEVSARQLRKFAVNSAIASDIILALLVSAGIQFKEPLHTIHVTDSHNKQVA